MGKKSNELKESGCIVDIDGVEVFIIALSKSDAMDIAEKAAKFNYRIVKHKSFMVLK